MSRTTLFLDCVGGVAGDMLLSALVEAASSASLIDALPASLGFDDVRLEWSMGRPGGFAARHLKVLFDPERHQRHRGLSDINPIIKQSNASNDAKEMALRVFHTLAVAEGHVHGEAPHEVHFHEVGAVDAIIDILGVCMALDVLKPGEIVCSALPMGHGTVECAHGTLPLPAPAVVAMLGGVPVYDAAVKGETVTPTGAALVTTLADRFGPMPTMTISAVGVGGGTRHYPGLPNVVRAFFGSSSPEQELPAIDKAAIVECNVDDLDPRVLPVVVDRLLASGALDAYITPLVMKKGRPGHLITAISKPDSTDALVRVLLHETTSLGCRVYAVNKYHLHRRMETVSTQWGPIPVKLAIADGTVLRRIPEFEPCAEIARKHGVAVRDVLAAAASAPDVPPED